ncbi:ABC transporter ATP-binding protein, partial [Glutamicibacter creatinolyticus]|uniref:ABC transporter ATP-binding protein n=1 Tax=Glutamicibacter creatinolyticus TaxID=162496 RepID=UPI003B987A6E
MLENTAVLSARALTRRYGSTTALDGVDLDVARGGSLAIMGPSGSGKSTLLHTLAGIEAPNSGSVTLALPGRAPVEITGLGEGQRSKLRREAFGFVFQSGLLIPELTAEENVEMALLINSTPRQRAIELGRQALIRMGLAGMEQRRIG